MRAFGRGIGLAADGRGIGDDQNVVRITGAQLPRTLVGLDPRHLAFAVGAIGGDDHLLARGPCRGGIERLQQILIHMKPLGQLFADAGIAEEFHLGLLGIVLGVGAVIAATSSGVIS